MTRTAAPAPSLAAALGGPAYPGTALLSLVASYFVLGVGALSGIRLIGPMNSDLGVSHAAVAQLVTVFALTYTSCPVGRPVSESLLAHGRPSNPVRIPVSLKGCRYYALAAPLL